MSKNEQDWNEWIASLLFAYRTAPHASTGISPFESMFGRKPKLPIHFRVPTSSPATESTTPMQHLSLVKESLQDLNSKVRENLKKSQAKMKYQHDKRSTAIVFDMGQQITLFNPGVKKGQSSKFRKLWTGPYIIERKIPPPSLNYLVRHKFRNKLQFVHRNRMKLLPDREEQMTIIYADDEERVVGNDFQREGEVVGADADENLAL